MYLKLFTPDSSWSWYVTEGSPIKDDSGKEVDFHFFGLVDGHEKELGYVALSELQGVRGPMGLPIERDLHWQPKMLEEMAQKQDKQLKLKDLVQYGLLKGEGDARKPSEQVYEFIHLSFQECLTAAHLCKALEQKDLEEVRKVAEWLAHHRHEPKYLMTLKFLAGLVSSRRRRVSRAGFRALI